MPRLPAPGSADPYLTLCGQAAQQLVRLRKAAIDQAAAMLQRGEYHEKILAVLKHLMHNDLMNGVREKAQAVLDADALSRRASPLAPVRP